MGRKIVILHTSQKLTEKRDYFILHLVVTLVIIFKNTHADKEQSGSGGKDEKKKLDFYDIDACFAAKMLIFLFNDI